MDHETRAPAPGRRRGLARPLTERERAGMLAAADALIPDGPAGPRPSRAPGYEGRLERALAARRDAWDLVTALARELADVPASSLLGVLRDRSAAGDPAFFALSSVLAGAYLMLPEVRRAIGYPGQGQRPPRFDEAADQIMDGILDPVVERGPVFRSADRAGTPGATR